MKRLWMRVTAVWEVITTPTCLRCRTRPCLPHEALCAFCVAQMTVVCDSCHVRPAVGASGWCRECKALLFGRSPASRR